MWHAYMLLIFNNFYNLSNLNILNIYLSSWICIFIYLFFVFICQLQFPFHPGHFHCTVFLVLRDAPSLPPHLPHLIPHSHLYPPTNSNVCSTFLHSEIHGSLLEPFWVLSFSGSVYYSMTLLITLWLIPLISECIPWLSFWGYALYHSSPLQLIFTYA